MFAVERGTARNNPNNDRRGGLIAAIIVLALIPVYLPIKDVSQNECNQTFSIIGDFNGTISNDDTLPNDARANIARTLESQLDLSLGDLIIKDAMVATIPTGRKRRFSHLIRSRHGQT